MKLTLDALDLKKKYQRKGENGIDQAISCREVTFDKLNDAAQAAVRTVGQGVFWAFDHMTHNAIYPPK